MNKDVSMVRVRHWSDVIQAANTSGIKKKVWCEHNGINLNTFYYWQRRIRDFALAGVLTPAGKLTTCCDDDNEDSIPEFFEISLQHDSLPARTFSKSDVASTVSSSTGISIRCGGLEVDICEGFSRSTLSDVLEVLKNV